MIRSGFAAILFWGIACLILLALASGIWWYAYPLIVHRQTYAAHQSYGYGVTQAKELVALESDYDQMQTKIDATKDPALIGDYKAEQAADLSRMRADIALMNPDDVPQSVRSFLESK